MRLCGQERTKTSLNSHKLTCKSVTNCYNRLSVKSVPRHHDKKPQSSGSGAFCYKLFISSDAFDNMLFIIVANPLTGYSGDNFPATGFIFPLFVGLIVFNLNLGPGGCQYDYCSKDKIVHDYLLCL